MIRTAIRPFSSGTFSAAASVFKYSAHDTLIPPIEFTTLPSIGLWSGCYELFHDFAIDSLTYMQSYGYGLGAGLIIFSFGMRSIFSPFILLSQINATKNLLLAPEMDKFKEEMMQAYRSGNQSKIAQLNLYQKTLRHKYKIKNIYSLIPVLQIPFVVYFFWTLQEMAYNIDVYPSMTTDGFLWFKNLAEADPYFILPVLMALTTFTTIHKSPNSAQAIGPAGQYLKYMKYLVFLGIPITSTFPAAIVLNWLMMSAFQLAINSLVYTRTGRKMLRIPQYLPGSILEKHNNLVKNPVIKPKVSQYKPNIPKSSD